MVREVADLSPLREGVIFVTGATGFLGRHLVERLSGEGATVRALARSAQKAAPIQHLPGVEIVYGDLTDAARMMEFVAGAHIVLHVGAALGGNLADQQAVNVEGTRHVMHAAVAAKVARVLHVSSVAVYGYQVDGDVTEDYPLAPGEDPYQVSKAAAEEVVRQVALEHGRSYAIVRPGAIYGPRARTWTGQFATMARRRPILFFGDGRGSIPAIFVDDVVELILRAAALPAADGQAFNATPDPAPTWREYLLAYARLFGHQRWLGLPVWLARGGAALARWTARRGTFARDLPTMVTYARRKVTYKTDRARELLGWRPAVGLDEGVGRCAEWLRSEGILRPAGD